MKSKRSLNCAALLVVAVLLTANLPGLCSEYFYVSDTTNGNVYRFDAATGAGGLLISGLVSPKGLAVGPDAKLYVATNNSILRFNATTGAFIDTFVPSGSGGLSNPTGLAFGHDGNLYVNSRTDGEVMRYNGITGAPMPAPIYDGAVFVIAHRAGLEWNEGLIFGPDGNMYICSWATHNVMRFDGASGCLIDIFANPGAIVSNAAPMDLAFGPDHNLYVAEGSWNTGGNSVLRFNGTNGSYIDTFVGSGGGDQLSQAKGLRFGPDNNLYVSSYYNGRVAKYDGTSGLIMSPTPFFGPITNGNFTYLARSGETLPPESPAHQTLYVSATLGNEIHRCDVIEGDGDYGDLDTGEIFASGITAPQGLDIGPDNKLYVATEDKVVRFDQVTRAREDFVSSGSGGLSGATGVLFGPDGNLYVSSFNTGQVMRYNGTTGAPMPASGKPGAVFAEGGSMGWNRGLTFGPDGNLYVASWTSHNVLRFNGTTGAYVGVFANVGSLVPLAAPFDVAFGGDGNLYVSDASWNANGNSVIRYNGTTGAFMDIFVPQGQGTSQATGLAFGPYGHLYVGSYYNGWVLRFDYRTGAYYGRPYTTYVTSSTTNATFIAISDYVLPKAEEISIADAKTGYDQMPVILKNVIVSAAFLDDNSAPMAFAVEDTSRACGIRVISSASVQAGDSVTIDGKLDTVDGERVVIAAEDKVTVNSGGNGPIEPVGLTNRSSGGGASGAQGAVNDDASKSATGLNNVGLLMTIWGKVTKVVNDFTYSGYFYVDDGSGIQDGSGNAGIMCRPPSTTGAYDLPNEQEYVKVTGVMGTKVIGGVTVRYFWTTTWSR